MYVVHRSFALKDNAVNAALDYVRYRNEPGYVRLGSEFVYRKLVAFRLGYEFQNKLSAANTLLYGIGVTLKSWNLDYALVPFQTLGPTHRFSLTYKFQSADREIVNAPAPEAEMLRMVELELRRRG